MSTVNLKNACTYCGRFMGYNEAILGYRTSTCGLGCHLNIMDGEEPLDDETRKENYTESKKVFDERRKKLLEKY
jgi:hypothetical protein